MPSEPWSNEFLLLKLRASFIIGMMTVVQNFTKWVETKDSAVLRRKRGPKVAKILSIIEFVEDENYMNMPGVLFPAVKEALTELWKDGNIYTEAVLTGGTGIGKSFLLNMSMGYMAYLTWVYHDIQVEMDLAPGTPLYLAMQAGTYDQAKNVLFRPFRNFVKRSPFFTKVFPYRQDTASELIFENGLIIAPFSGSDDAIAGLTVIGAGVTELNLMAYIKKSARSRTNAEQEYDQAVKLYEALIRRMVGRTMQLGRLWGKAILDAASETEDDFTKKRIKERDRGNKTIFVYEKAQWDPGVIPESRRSGSGVFLVEVGNEFRKSRIIQDRAQAHPESKVIEIPNDFKPWIDVEDIEGALRAFGGITVGSQHPAIPYREKIKEGIEQFEAIAGERGQLFLRDSIMLQDIRDQYGDDPDWWALVNRDYVENVLLDRKSNKFAAQVDLALKHDAGGLGVASIVGWQLKPMIKKYNPRRHEYVEKRDNRVPIVSIHGLLQILAPPGEEVDLGMIEQLIIFLAEVLNMGVVGIDSYQSAQMIQAWVAAGIPAGVISMDASPEPYTRFKHGYRDGRIRTARHEVFIKEVTELQWDGKKYDHLPQGSKDVCDGAGGAFYLCETHIGNYTPVGTRGDQNEYARRVGQQRGRRVAMGRGRRG
jgi:hypothetical protein